MLKRPTDVFVAVIYGLCLLSTFWIHQSRAQVYIEPEIARALAARGIRNAAEINRIYPYVMRGIGASVRNSSTIIRHINTRTLGELGVAFADHPPVRQAVVNLIRNGNFRNAEELARYLAKGPLQNVIMNTVPDSYREQALNAAYKLTQEGGRGSVRRAVTQQAASGLSSTLRSWTARIGSRLGSVVRWLTSQTASRILGAYTIAEFTQSQINEALFAFQDEMEAIGDAYEAEAYNNNLQLMLNGLQDNRLVLVRGLTLSEAVRQLRRNMNRGRDFFAGIVEKPLSRGPLLALGQWVLDYGDYKASHGKIEAAPTGDGKTSYYTAPASFLGNWAGYRALSFSLKSWGGSYYGPDSYSAYGDVVIRSGSVIARFDIGDSHGGGMRNYRISFDDPGWRLSGGVRAMSDILDNVTELKIRAEYGAGTDYSVLQSVSLDP